MANENRLKVLFICTGNSCRSQMAEGWARHLKSDAIEAYSAGVEAGPLDPNAVKVMAEAGVDISNQRPKLLETLQGIDFDYVVTLCEAAQQTCPVFPGHLQVLHVAFDDPPELARSARTIEEALVHYRRVRNEIEAFIESMPQSLATASKK